MKPLNSDKEVNYSFHEKLRLALNSKTDGTSGAFRAPLNYKLIAPNNDSEAISEFLEIHSNNDTTFRIYQKELVRLQMYAVLKLGIALSSMTLDNYRDYIRFISDPDDDWCGPRALKGSVEWRPFQPKKYDENQKLILPSLSSLMTIIASVSSYIDWLCKGGYLIGNPLFIIKSEFINHNPQTVRNVNKTTHYYDENSFRVFLDVLEGMPKGSPAQIHKYEQSRILISLIYYLNLKLPEISKATMGNFVKVDDKWYWLMTKTKGAIRKIMLEEEMLNNLIRWRLYLHLPALPSVNDAHPIIPFCNLNGEPQYYRDGLGPRMLATLIQSLVKKTAEEISKTNKEKAQHFLNASSHWVRYTKLRQETLFS